MTPADVIAAATARTRFAAEVMRGEGKVKLALAALLVGAEEEPRRCDVRASLELLEAYGAEARSRVARAAGRELEAFNDYLFAELGFAGNREEYYDPANSLLHRVLERQTGIPITLSIVYMEIGRRAGLKVEGIGLPGHFIVRATVNDSATLVDPFEGKTTDEEECQQRLDSLYGGQLSLTEEHLRSTSARAIIVRLLGNLKAVYVQTQLYRRALAAVERILLLAPHSLEERRDRGLLLAQLGRLHEAVQEIQSYLNLAPEAQDAATVREQFNKLRMRLAMLN